MYFITTDKMFYMNIRFQRMLININIFSERNEGYTHVEYTLCYSHTYSKKGSTPQKYVKALIYLEAKYNNSLLQFYLK